MLGVEAVGRSLDNSHRSRTRRSVARRYKRASRERGRQRLFGIGEVKFVHFRRLVFLRPNYLRVASRLTRRAKLKFKLISRKSQRFPGEKWRKIDSKGRILRQRAKFGKKD